MNSSRIVALSLILIANGVLAGEPEVPNQPQYGCPSCALESFQLDYVVSRNDKALGQAILSLRRSDDDWELKMEVEASKGMASLTGYKEVERSVLRGSDQGWQVLSYKRERKVLFRDRQERMDFDWSAATLHSNDGDKDSLVYLPPGAVDSNSLTLRIGDDLRNGRTPEQYLVARRGKVDSWRFRIAGEEQIDGHKVIRVERVRENSGRTTTTWFSPDHDYLPLRLEQVEEDGERIRMDLRNYSGTVASTSAVAETRP